MRLKNCWEIKKCGCGRGLARTLGWEMCDAARLGLGHSCWTVANKLCGANNGWVIDAKKKNCAICEVYLSYNRSFGEHGHEIEELFPEEHKRYLELLKTRLLAFEQAFDKLGTGAATSDSVDENMRLKSG